MNLYQIPLSERLAWVWRFTLLCHSGQYPLRYVTRPSPFRVACSTVRRIRRNDVRTKSVSSILHNKVSISPLPNTGYSKCKHLSPKYTSIPTSERRVSSRGISTHHKVKFYWVPYWELKQTWRFAQKGSQNFYLIRYSSRHCSSCHRQNTKMSEIALLRAGKRTWYFPIKMWVRQPLFFFLRLCSGKATG